MLSREVVWIKVTIFTNPILVVKELFKHFFLNQQLNHYEADNHDLIYEAFSNCSQTISARRVAAPGSPLTCRRRSRICANFSGWSK